MDTQQPTEFPRETIQKIAHAISRRRTLKDDVLDALDCFLERVEADPQVYEREYWRNLRERVAACSTPLDEAPQAESYVIIEELQPALGVREHE